VHGTGIRFLFDLGSVDMNRQLDGDARAFDAWRLAEYFDSVGQSLPVSEEADIALSGQRWQRILRTMCTSGAIRRLESTDGELFVTSK
jgi:hypothetical protein